VTTAAATTAWERGRFDARSGPGQVLFGRMYEDASIELDAFRPGGRIFCIASAGCTAMKLAPRHEVVAVDINPAQLAYAARRFAGTREALGSAERLMAFGRAFAPLAGWWPSKVRAFLDLEDTSEQIGFWRRHLDTRRFRAALDVFFSGPALRAAYAPRFLDFLPRDLGGVMRGRMERCFARHANRTNPHARALLLGELTHEPPPPEAREIRLVHADAAAHLEGEPAGSFDGFTLSNILDGADASYARRLFAAVRRAAAPGAVVVLRSFAEARDSSPNNHAVLDRAMLWGIVDVRPALALEDLAEPSGGKAGRAWKPRGAAPRSTSIVTRAKLHLSPEQAWDELMFYEEIAARPPLLLRLLLPRPVRAEGRKERVGDEARCLYRSGHLVKRVTRIDRGRGYEFEVVEQNLSIGGGIRLAGGSYTLSGLSGGRTEVALRTRFVSPSRPRWLWGPIEAALCHLFHRHILGAMRRNVSSSRTQPLCSSHRSRARPDASQKPAYQPALPPAETR
jgi:hypothetical protein